LFRFDLPRVGLPVQQPASQIAALAAAVQPSAPVEAAGRECHTRFGAERASKTAS